MVYVAVAGGPLPTLGKSIMTALLEAKHQVVILSRETPNQQMTLINFKCKLLCTAYVGVLWLP